MKTFVGAKIHGIRVTDKSVKYHGSVSIAQDLMDAVHIEPYEQVHIINLHNGNRWVTYALPAPRGVFSLNGGGARLGEINDECVVLTYGSEEAFEGAAVVFCDEHNHIEKEAVYALEGTRVGV